jgi:hypothetical protein
MKKSQGATDQPSQTGNIQFFPVKQNSAISSLLFVTEETQSINEHKITICSAPTPVPVQTSVRHRSHSQHSSNSRKQYPVQSIVARDDNTSVSAYSYDDQSSDGSDWSEASSYVEEKQVIGGSSTANRNEKNTQNVVMTKDEDKMVFEEKNFFSHASANMLKSNTTTSIKQSSHPRLSTSSITDENPRLAAERRSARISTHKTTTGITNAGSHQPQPQVLVDIQPSTIDAATSRRNRLESQMLRDEKRTHDLKLQAKNHTVSFKEEETDDRLAPSNLGASLRKSRLSQARLR